MCNWFPTPARGTNRFRDFLSNHALRGKSVKFREFTDTI